MAAALIIFVHGNVPLFVIGIPASLIPVYVWVRFARTPKGRR
jgi:hypothetical protein